MAIRFAVANGNWSNTATWDGGTLPGSTDDVYANNRTVSIDVDITVNSLKKISNVSPAISAGGLFTTTTTTSITITAGIQTTDNVTNSGNVLTVASSATPLTITAPGGVAGGAGTSRTGMIVETRPVTIIADLTGGTGSNAHAVQVAGTDTTVILGNIAGGSASGHGINLAGATGRLEVTGNVVGGVSTTAFGIRLSGGANTALVTGDVVGGSAGNAIDLLGNLTEIDVVGTVTGGSGSAAHGVFTAGTNSIVRVTGSAIGGSNGGHGVNGFGGSSLIEVTGAITGGSAANSFGVIVRGGWGTLRGDFRPGSAAAGSPAFGTDNAGLVRISGDIYAGGFVALSGPPGFSPVIGAWSVIEGEDVRFHIFNDDNFPFGLDGTQTVLTRYGSDLPDEEDVRAGTAYGTGGTLEGTLAVPPTGSVAAGVPVDATVGTATLSLADVAAVTGAQIAAATSDG